MRIFLIAATAMLVSFGAADAASDDWRPGSSAATKQLSEVLLAQNRRSCKAARDCRNAVIMWCKEGYRGADRDKDGIPCENVCRSRAQVKQIMTEVGC